jgi:hypothetical protein
MVVILGVIVVYRMYHVRKLGPAVDDTYDTAMMANPAYRNTSGNGSNKWDSANYAIGPGASSDTGLTAPLHSTQAFVSPEHPSATIHHSAA